MRAAACLVVATVCSRRDSNRVRLTRCDSFRPKQQLYPDRQRRPRGCSLSRSGTLWPADPGAMAVAHVSVARNLLRPPHKHATVGGSHPTTRRNRARRGRSHSASRVTVGARVVWRRDTLALAIVGLVLAAAPVPDLNKSTGRRQNGGPARKKRSHRCSIKATTCSGRTIRAHEENMTDPHARCPSRQCGRRVLGGISAWRTRRNPANR